MKNKRGFTFVELLAVIVVIGIVITIAVPAYNGIKSRFDKRAYENKVSVIEVAAAKYSEDTRLDIFYVDDLIKNGYLDADNEDGNLLNPVNNERLNCYLIKSSEDKGVYTSKLSEEKYDDNGVCNENIPATISNSLKIELYDSLTGGKIEYDSVRKWWNKNNVNLRMQVGSAYQNKVKKIEWFEGYSEKPIANSDNKTQILVSSDSVLQQNYKVKVTLEDGSSLSNIVRVYIDKIKPAFYATDSVETKWVTQLSYDIKAYDNESGLYGYKLIENGSSCPTDKKEYSSKRKNTIYTNGNKKTCIIDNVGNITEKTFNVANIDNVGVPNSSGSSSNGGSSNGGSSNSNGNNALGPYVSFECNFAVNGTLGNKLSGVQWYKSNTTLTLTPSNVGVSGVSLGISTSTTPQYTAQFTYEQKANAKATHTISNNQASTTYYGYIKNQAGATNKCSQTLGVEKSITAPSFTNGSISRNGSKITINANYSAGSAVSGIASTKCELLNTSGNVAKTGTLSGNNCTFDVSTLANGNYYSRKCITSNAGNSACSANTSVTVSKKTYDIYHGIYFSDPELYKADLNQEWHSDCNIHKYKIGSQELSYVEYCDKTECKINNSTSSCSVYQFIQYIGSYYGKTLQYMTGTFGDSGGRWCKNGISLEPNGANCGDWHVAYYSMLRNCPGYPTFGWLKTPADTVCYYGQNDAGPQYYAIDWSSGNSNSECPIENQCTSMYGYIGYNVHDWSSKLKE